MKKILLPVLAAALLAGCAKEGSNPANNGPVPIRLGSGIGMEVTSKAPINPTENGTATFPATIVGWESATTPDYSTATTWQNSLTVKASTNEQAVTWTDGTEYYNSNEAIETYMLAWHPEGSLSGSTVTFTNGNDGSKDAMITQVVNRNKNTGNTDIPTLNFEHKSAQVLFKVKTDEEEYTGGEITPLTSITIKNVKTVTGFDLSTSPFSAIYSTSPTNVNVPVTSNLTIKNEVQDAGEGVMIAPEGNSITLDVVAGNVTYPDQVVKLIENGNIEEGKSYIVTLTFTRQGIQVQATVKAWEPGNGSGTDIDLI